MTKETGHIDASGTNQTRPFSASRRARKAAPDTSGASLASSRRPALEADRPSDAPVRAEKVEELRRKVNDPDFNLDEAFDKAIRVMLSKELGL
jgi:anti-sigma28 factor (negative regulator of flagellin synthesis)